MGSSVPPDGALSTGSRPRIVDTHFHLDRVENPERTAARIEREGVYCICVTNLPSDFISTASVAAGCKFIRPALGLHPELSSVGIRQLSLFDEFLATTRYVGEVGLDYTMNAAASESHQRRVFDHVLSRCSESGDKILTIHSRRAADDVVRALESGFSGKAILHWYAGSLSVLERAVAAGCYVSFNTRSVVAKSAGEMIRILGRERVLTESDGPFIKVRNRGAEPWDIVDVLDKLANFWGGSASDAGAQVYRNFGQLLNASAGPRIDGPGPTSSPMLG